MLHAGDPRPVIELVAVRRVMAAETDLSVDVTTDVPRRRRMDVRQARTVARLALHVRKSYVGGRKPEPVAFAIAEHMAPDASGMKVPVPIDGSPTVNVKF